MKKTIYIGTSIFLMLVIFQILSFNKEFDSDFNPFGIDGGYGPGSIIEEKEIGSLFRSKIKIQEIIPVNYLRTHLLKEDLLNTTPPKKIPKSEAKKYAEIHSEFIIDSIAMLKDVAVKNEMQKITYSNLEIDEGKRYGLENGFLTLHKIINNLPLEELKSLKKELSIDKDLVFVTEVKEYKNARLALAWNSTVKNSLRSTIQKILPIDASLNWTTDDSLIIAYKDNVIVGYKGKKIDKKYIEQIDSIIQIRQENGDIIRWYRDVDGDGYGDPSQYIIQSRLDSLEGYVLNTHDKDDQNKCINPKSMIWYADKDGDGYGDATDSIECNTQPPNYVSDNYDTDDTDACRYPGEKTWYEDKDKDGYGNVKSKKVCVLQPLGFVSDSLDTNDGDKDINPKATDWFRDADGDGYGTGVPKKSVNQPKGYVKNNHDCCDKDANVFPHQTKYFAVKNQCGNFDYNCNKDMEKEFMNAGECDGSCGKAARTGWFKGINPPCGSTGSWLVDCDFLIKLRYTGCKKETVAKRQKCR